MSFLDFILDQESIPQTLTTSYGDDEQTVPYDYAVAVCNGFAKLGARGSSVLFSSGDYAVGGGDCLSNDGENRIVFQPIFPATCTCLAPRIFRITHHVKLRSLCDICRWNQRNCARAGSVFLWRRFLELFR